jgi:hypothetical protein
VTGAAARCQGIIRRRGDYEQCARPLGHRGRCKRGEWGDRRRKLSGGRLRRIWDAVAQAVEAQCPECGGALAGVTVGELVTTVYAGRRWLPVRVRTEREWRLEPCGHVFAETVPGRRQ